MKGYALSQLSDDAVSRGLAEMIARDRAATADLLAHIAEFDARKLYLPAAYPSMFAYCVGELHLSEDAAAKRIQAGRAARRFPAILGAVAEGRLHLSGVCLLAAHLTEDTAGELLAAATHKTKAEIEQLLAERFPRSGMLAWVEEHAPGHAQVARPSAPEPVSMVQQHAPGHVESEHYPVRAPDRPKVKPLAPQAFGVQFTMSQSMRDKLRYAQELLGHQIPSGDIGQVFELALDALISRLEKRKFAATSKPRTDQRPASKSPRHIPAHVRRAVWERDQGRCTFVGEAGRRCEARKRLEFDHVQEVARGGESTVAGIRLRCRAHNQFGAERTFGSEFMRHKRIAAAERRESARLRSPARPGSPQTGT